MRIALYFDYVDPVFYYRMQPWQYLARQSGFEIHNVEVVSTGDFSDFVKDGKVDVDKLIVALFKGDVYISTRLKQ